MPKPGSKMQMMATAERRREVLRLRESGATYPAIAQALLSRHGEEALPSGWDERYAYKDVKRELDRARDANAEKAEAVRELELRRLDKMLEGLWEEAAAGDVKAVSAALRLMERRARLLGLDEPERFEQAVSVLDSEGYQNMRAALMRSLEDFPEARAALAGALEDAEGTDD